MNFGEYKVVKENISMASMFGIPQKIEDFIVEESAKYPDALFVMCSFNKVMPHCAYVIHESKLICSSIGREFLNFNYEHSGDLFNLLNDECFLILSWPKIEYLLLCSPDVVFIVNGKQYLTECPNYEEVIRG